MAKTMGPQSSPASRVSLRLTTEQKARYQAAAERVGLYLEDWITEHLDLAFLHLAADQARAAYLIRLREIYESEFQPADRSEESWRLWAESREIDEEWLRDWFERHCVEPASVDPDSGVIAWSQFESLISDLAR